MKRTSIVSSIERRLRERPGFGLRVDTYVNDCFSRNETLVMHITVTAFDRRDNPSLQFTWHGTSDYSNPVMYYGNFVFDEPSNYRFVGNGKQLDITNKTLLYFVDCFLEGLLIDSTLSEAA